MGDAERNDLIRQRLSKNHPNLATEHFRATSPYDNGYNCLAWAGNDTTRQWHPCALGDLYWPCGERLDNLEEWIAGYAELGYDPCDSPDLEPQMEKLAIYAQGDYPTHIARQLASGKWTSKMGKSEDIEHTLKGLEGGKYGVVSVLLRRPVGGQLSLLNQFEGDGK